MITEEKRQELIMYCENSIAGLTKNIEDFKKLKEHNPEGVIAMLQQSLDVSKIALASLKAEVKKITFNSLRDTVAEMTGGIEHQWVGGHKGHDSVPFMNFNSLMRLVKSYRTDPVVSTLKLPQDLYEHKSGLVGHYPTLTLQTPDWAEGYREAILDVKLINEVE